MKKPLVMGNKIGIDTMLHNRGMLTAVELSGPEPVFYHQEAVEGTWPEHLRCRYSEPSNIGAYLW